MTSAHLITIKKQLKLEFFMSLLFVKKKGSSFNLLRLKTQTFFPVMQLSSA